MTKAYRTKDISVVCFLGYQAKALKNVGRQSYSFIIPPFPWNGIDKSGMRYSSQKNSSSHKQAPILRTGWYLSNTQKNAQSHIFQRCTAPTLRVMSDMIELN